MAIVTKNQGNGVVDYFNWVIGDTESLVVIVTENWVPLDITWFIFYFTVKSSAKLTDEQAEFQQRVDVHNDPVNGVTSFTINKDQYWSITPDRYIYDMQYTTNTWSVATFARGNIDFTNQVTISND